MKDFILAANWKMNKTSSEAVKFVRKLKNKIKKSKSNIMIFPSYLSIPALAKLKINNLSVGAQNMHYAEKGTFTGEVSLSMLNDLSVKSVLIGHSERRTIFGETDELINKKMTTALYNGLTTILCIGETYDEKVEKITSKVLKKQLQLALKGIERDKVNGKLIVAYEPVWAISSGDPNKPKLTPTAKEIEKTHKLIKAELSKIGFNDIMVLYGGSANENNCKEFMQIDGVDGFLIGGASLVYEKFTKMIDIANKYAIDTNN